ncbi:MAG: hypothetical protein ACW967_01635 [Candidatus Hodarchaeales archaeon]|jgi:type IV secretory pathway VirB4 component
MANNSDNDIVAVFIFKAITGATLYSKKILIFHDDLFAAFLSAFRTFFNEFLLGGLTLFASNEYILYLVSKNDLLTTIIVDKKKKSNKYYSLGYKITEEFYNDYKSIIEDTTPLIPTHQIKFDEKLFEILENYNVQIVTHLDVLKFYQIDSNGIGKEFSFISEDHLFSIPLFLVSNLVTNQIFILENDNSLPRKAVFQANKFASNLNQQQHKSLFTIRNVSEPWDCERLITEFRNILLGQDISLF